MKKTISTIGIITVIILFLGYTSISCGKKKEMDMHNITVSMSYTPNPALKDSLITISFLVKDEDVPTNVTDYTCTTKHSSATTTTPVTLTQGATGTYTGQCAFSTLGDYNVTMSCMHSGENVTNQYSITVQ